MGVRSGFSAVLAASTALIALSLSDGGVLRLRHPARHRVCRTAGPSSGEGFESALAYTVADKLGFGRGCAMGPSSVQQRTGAGPKNARRQSLSVLDHRPASGGRRLSSPYFDVTQVVATTEASPAAGARSLAELRKVQLGVQVGTTSHNAAAAVEGNVPIEVYNTTADAKVALNSARSMDWSPICRPRSRSQESCTAARSSANCRQEQLTDQMRDGRRRRSSRRRNLAPADAVARRCRYGAGVALTRRATSCPSTIH